MIGPRPTPDITRPAREWHDALTEWCDAIEAAIRPSLTKGSDWTNPESAIASVSPALASLTDEQRDYAKSFIEAYCLDRLHDGETPPKDAHVHSYKLRKAFRVGGVPTAICLVCCHPYGEHHADGSSWLEQNACSHERCSCVRFDPPAITDVPSQGTQRTSPIEQAFAGAWDEIGSPRHLVPQYRIGSFRVDFAHIETRTIVELDGFEHHSSTIDIEKDRKRQRFIEDAGWHVIRFGGREVHHAATKCAREVLARIERRERDGGRT